MKYILKWEKKKKPRRISTQQAPDNLRHVAAIRLLTRADLLGEHSEGCAAIAGMATTMRVAAFFPVRAARGFMHDAVDGLRAEMGSRRPAEY